MTPLLLIAPLPPADSAGEYDWAQAGDDGIALRDHGHALLALLPASPDVMLGIPAAALSWHRVTLPKGSMGSTSKLRAVLDGLLEEQLLDEPEALASGSSAKCKASGSSSSCSSSSPSSTARSLEVLPMLPLGRVTRCQESAAAGMPSMTSVLAGSSASLSLIPI